MKLLVSSLLFISLASYAQEDLDKKDHSKESAEEHASHGHDHLRRLFRTFDTIGNEDAECSPPPAPVKELDAESKLLADKKWFEGAPNCNAKGAKEPPYEVLKVNETTYVMRQNKCINFEAPFVYLYIGDDKAFLFDTGATGNPNTMPIRKWVDDMLKNHPKKDKLELIVAHSHAHGDHMAGDDQFEGRPNTKIIGSSPEEVASAFGIKNWPKGEGELDLGNRKLSILPIPGHEDSSIAVYDHKSGDMLTGDTIYPGNVFLSESTFPEFKDSINRLHAFSQKHPIRNMLGAHVEMSAEPGKDFPYGSTYHPNEHKLPLRQEHLDELKNYLDGNPRPTYKKFSSIILNM